jgi:hypothetical protein
MTMSDAGSLNSAIWRCLMSDDWPSWNMTRRPLERKNGTCWRSAARLSPGKLCSKWRTRNPRGSHQCPLEVRWGTNTSVQLLKSIVGYKKEVGSNWNWSTKLNGNLHPYIKLSHISWQHCREETGAQKQHVVVFNLNSKTAEMFNQCMDVWQISKWMSW